MSDHYQNNHRSRSKQSPPPGIEQQIVEGIFKGAWWLITLPFKKRSGAKRGKNFISAQSAQHYALYWQDISEKLSNPATRDLAVSEADKLFDAVLKELNISGANMGERMKAAEGLFSQQQYNQLWEAHKLRNRLAHEVGISVSEAEIKSAVAAFQWGLRTLGVMV